MFTAIMLCYVLPMILSSFVWYRMQKIDLKKGFDLTVGTAFIIFFTVFTPAFNWLIPVAAIFHSETRKDVFGIDFAKFFDKPLIKGKRNEKFR